jgi:hypothetical protein
MTIDHLDEYDAQLSQLDASLKRLSNGLYYKLKRLGNRVRFKPSLQVYASLDELGKRAEAMRLMTAVAELYASAPESRDHIRGIFERYGYVRAVLWPSQEPTTPEHFRLWLLVISMRDAGDDPRDMAYCVSKACKVAISADVDVGPILESVAAISNDRREYRFGSSVVFGASMRDVMLEAKDRYLRGEPCPLWRWLDAPPPSPAESKHRWDLEFYNRLGLERSDQPCRKEGCPRGAVDQSAYCRVHHFEMVMGKPCPFSH